MDKQRDEITDPTQSNATTSGVSPIANALFIGILVGIIIYSVVKNTWGLVTLIPLILIYKAIKNSKRNDDPKK